MLGFVRDYALLCSVMFGSSLNVAYLSSDDSNVYVCCRCIVLSSCLTLKRVPGLVVCSAGSFCSVRLDTSAFALRATLSELTLCCNRCLSVSFLCLR